MGQVGGFRRQHIRKRKNMKEKLSRGQRLRLKTPHTFALELSPGGGASQVSELKVPAGTEVTVARDCDQYVCNIPFHFAQDFLRAFGKGEPFFTHRHSLEEAVA